MKGLEVRMKPSLIFTWVKIFYHTFFPFFFATDLVLYTFFTPFTSLFHLHFSSLIIYDKYCFIFNGLLFDW